MSKVLKNLVYVVAGLIVFIVFAFGFFGLFSNSNNLVSAKIVNSVQSNSDGFQEVVLSFENYEYKLNPSDLKVGVPVRMIVDLDSVYGCMRDIVIPSANIRKYVSASDNVIEFIPQSAGTFNIRCSMNMGRGTFSVSDSTGDSSNFVEELAAEGSSCQNDGGCGCGGEY